MQLMRLREGAFFDIILLEVYFMLSNFDIEKLERKYLKKFSFFLKYVEDEMIEGFNSKEKIRPDWAPFYGKGKKKYFRVGRWCGKNCLCLIKRESLWDSKF